MKAMVIQRIAPMTDASAPLQGVEWPDPDPGDREIRIRVTVCGVCHTELDEIEGRTPPPRLPVIPGHQVVGTVDAVGARVKRFQHGDRVGVAWLYHSCGQCDLCRSGRENLCPQFQGTGRDAHGGYAEFMVVPETSAHRIPGVFTDAQAAPLLCAGAIGFRSMALSGITNGARIGLTGFGASAHLVLKMAAHRYPDSPVYVFARSPQEQEFSRELGAVWAGDTSDMAPEALDAIIDTTPAWTPVVRALENLRPGGRLVINAIRKEDRDKAILMELDYSRHLWMEKEIKSVANVQRTDVREFLQLAAEIPILPEVQTFPLEDANRALMELKQRKIRGAKVLTIGTAG